MKRILIVDDSPSVIRVVKMALSMEGYDITSAANAEQAEEIVKNSSFDFGIFDVNMPGKNGIELVRSVLSMPNGKDMKILILTTESSDELKKKGREAGAKGWLIKPFNHVDLLTVLKKLGAS